VGADYNFQSTASRLPIKWWPGRIVSIVLVIGVVLGWRAYQNPLLEVPYPKHYPQAAEKLLANFHDHDQSKDTLSMENYEQLFTYFLEGYYFYKSKSGALVNYPGLPSKHERLVDQMEGFTRIAPLIGAWLYSGRSPSIALQNGKNVDLAVLLKKAIIAGTDPESEEYWGHIKISDQRIVEAADIALVLWMTRTQLWDTLRPHQQKHIATWLVQVNGKKIPDNIWHLFVALVNAVLIDLGQEEGSEKQIQQHYVTMKSFYRGKGWFTDGLKHGKRFDHYNAWGIHYALYWLNKMKPDLDSPFIQDAVGDFSESYKLLFTPNGFPIYGRSICYRMALPAPLIIASTHSPKRVSSGEARRAMDLTWRYFIQHGALRAGTVTQGYCGTDPRILDHYSGQGSCLWSLRSLIVALSLPATDAYWQTTPERLPIEKQNYTVTLDVPGWVVSGDSQHKQVTLQRVHDNKKRADSKLEEYSWLESFKEKFTHRLARPKNTEAMYDGSSYSSELPFCGCALSGK
jgi:hypothetical protein